jgi:hypothetical protein
MNARYTVTLDTVVDFEAMLRFHETASKDASRPRQLRAFHRRQALILGRRVFTWNWQTECLRASRAVSSAALT